MHCFCVLHCILIRFSTSVMMEDGIKTLGIRPGHIPDCPPRRNEHTGLDELFDTNQIFLSPAIKYSSNPSYASFEVTVPCPP